MDQVQKEFQPRYWNPSEQDIDEAMWCVRTNPPHTCAHDPECRDVFYAEILRMREENAVFKGAAVYACGHIVKAREDGHSIGCPICAELYNAYKHGSRAESK